MDIIKTLCVLWPMSGGGGEEINKVYCSECEHYDKIIEKVYCSECFHPNNLGTWLSKIEPRRHPRIINEYNNCSWFECKEKEENNEL